VADGYGARYFKQLHLTESEEMRDDAAYLEAEAEKLRAKGLTVRTLLALGDPPKEILKASVAHAVELIMMGSHGHKIIGDFFHGSTVRDVRHGSSIPVLVVPSKR
ncbi:MAG: universal stress protein, partial [Bradyrhizobiaceae bacterium]|nr:universal stress protein [Bradyrhizobiaceae bacterium]